MNTRHLAAIAAAVILLHTARALAAGDPWLERCHGLPTFKQWSVEPATYGSANIVYQFSSYCGTESALFGHDDLVISIKGRWNYGTKQAFEYVTATDYHIDANNQQSVSQDTISLLYYCGKTDPWAEQAGDQCKVGYCTASRSKLCGVTDHYTHFPITYDLVPEEARTAAYNALVGPLVVTNPTAGELLAPGSPATGDVRVELRGHAPSTPGSVDLSFELNGAGWAEYFPQEGKPLHTPLTANIVPGPKTETVSAVYQAPLTADSFQVDPTDLVTGEWRVKACAKRPGQTLCSRWVEFDVADTAAYRVPSNVFRRGFKVMKPKDLKLNPRN